MNTSIILKQIESFYSNLDTELSKAQTSCRKGCSYCCCYRIYVTPLEGLYVETYLKSIEPSLFQTIQTQWSAWFKKCTQLNLLSASPLQPKEAFFERNDKYFANKIKCPFLVNNDCAIYMVRPIICRTHFVKTNPELCKDGLPPDIESISIHSKAFKAMVMLHQVCRVTPLQYLLPGNLVDLFCPNENQI